MRVVKATEETGVTIPAPYQRTIKVLFAPDRHGVAELTFSHVRVHAGSRTDYHAHDRPELIYIISGQGVAHCEQGPVLLESGVALWVLAGEGHQIQNEHTEDLTFATVFVPAYEAEANYQRCLDAAINGAAGNGSKGRS